MLRLVTPPADGLLAVSLGTAKNHLNVDFDDDDVLISAYITAAMTRVEQECRALAVLPSTWAHDRKQFCGAMDLPLAPVKTVSSVAYYDAAGARQILDPSVYSLAVDASGKGALSLGYGQTWPALRGGRDDVTITFTAGFDVVPQAIQAAILLLVGGLYEQRADVTARTVFQVPDAVCALLARYRVW